MEAVPQPDDGPGHQALLTIVYTRLTLTQMRLDAIAKSQSTEDQLVCCGPLSDRREGWTQRLRSFFGSDGLTMEHGRRRGGYEGPLARASKYSPTLTRAKRQATGSTV